MPSPPVSGDEIINVSAPIFPGLEPGRNLKSSMCPSRVAYGRVGDASSQSQRPPQRHIDRMAPHDNPHTTGLAITFKVVVSPHDCRSQNPRRQMLVRHDRPKLCSRRGTIIYITMWYGKLFSGRFALDAEERAALSEICEPLRKTKTVTVTRHYSDKTTVAFSPEPKLPEAGVLEWTKTLKTMASAVDEATAPEGKGDAWKPVKQSVRTFLDGQVSAASQPAFVVRAANAEQVRKHLLGHANEEWLKIILKPVVDMLDSIEADLNVLEAHAEAKSWAVKNMPYFLYFGKYEVLRSAIYLPEFIGRVNGNSKSPETRVQLALFRHVGVDVKELAHLGQHQPGQGFSQGVQDQVDKLTVMANSAERAMTTKFSGWWDQRRHEFHYEFNGEYFRIWVGDDLDPVKVELEERSEGMRYFFSFYLVFLVEAEDQHSNCILLLDEPGLHLHGTAQGKLISFLERLSARNQLLYTTHSPFMIDGAHLERARAVYETLEGTKVSADVWPRDRDTLFPLQAALGYSVCQTLFIAKKQVMVEGLTDYMLLSALNERARANGKGLRGDAVMLPMGGTTNLAPLASMLVGHNVELAIFLDSDPAGIGAMKKLRHLLTDLDQRCVLARQFATTPDGQELEDLIPEDYYLEAVKEAYGIELAFDVKERAIKSVVDRCEAFLKRVGRGNFEKWRPIQMIVRDIAAGSSVVPAVLHATAQRIFARFNQILGET